MYMYMYDFYQPVQAKILSLPPEPWRVILM